MSLTDTEKTEIRKHCGYPAYGSEAEGSQGWRFHQAYGLMEYRMIRMSGAEEAVARQYLAKLAVLVERIDGGDRSKATVALYEDWRRRLCGFLGIPPGPALQRAGVTP